MAKYLEIAEQTMEKIKARRKSTENLPWPGYNGGMQFVCDHCGVHFDTSAGFAQHQVNEHSEEK
jgi:hypothetical protein